MKTLKGEVLKSVQSSVGVKNHPNRYAYADKFRNWLDQMDIRIVSVENVLVQHGIPRETVKSFFTGKHIPSLYIGTLITDIWGYKFHHKDFEEQHG
jgi:hypothetical protein